LLSLNISSSSLEELKQRFMSLDDLLLLRKTYRLPIFCSEMQIVDTYFDKNIEICLEHDSFGIVRLVCEKEFLTEGEKQENKEVAEKGKEPLFKRGDKHYNLIGLVKKGCTNTTTM